jgi:hypothetical protein
MAGKVFVSPGFYSTERDLTFVTRQVGVTTLGLVGETTQGPAFQPIFVSNYDEFRSFFGGQNATKIKDTGAPKYELPYIAKSYLSKSNQLFVTRILGLSGYGAGKAWGITLSAALDETTLEVSTPATSYSPLIEFEANSTGQIISLTSSDPLLQDLWDNGVIGLDFLVNQPVGPLSNIGLTLQKNGTIFEGVEVTNFEMLSITTDATGTSGVTSGVTTQYTGSGYADVEGKLLALLRSRGKYNSSETLIYDILGINDVNFGISPNTAENDPRGDFSIVGTSVFSGPFTYDLSFDRTKKNYITRVLGRSAQDSNTSLFVEEIYNSMFDDFLSENKILGINIDPISGLARYENAFDNYYSEYQPAVTPWVVSELRGTNLLRLFRFWTISDGDSANTQFKVSIRNILPDTRQFDVEIRAYNDTDARPVVLERFSRCSMNPNDIGYIAKRIGTIDGEFTSRSNYILVELEEESDTSDAFPAGFVGYPIRDYKADGNTNVEAPIVEYKKTYGQFENKRKAYLGLTNDVGIDTDLFKFKGAPNSTLSSNIMWTGLTKGFHMDIDANTATIDNVSVVVNATGGTYTPVFEFETGNAEFRNEFDLDGTDYEKVFSRKFTMVPYGGFDGWDVYRTRRTNTDRYRINGVSGQNGLTSGVFKNRALANGDNGINSDYYAYLEGIWTFKNPEETNINVFATPGIDTFDNTNLVEETIEMIEQDRADSIYIVTTPDTDVSGDVLLPEDVVNQLDGEFDSNYTATYWPWIQINDAENNVFIYVPPTRDVVRNIALTDNIAFPWFAVAGVQRGDVDAIKARVKLTLADRDVLYDNRINPIATFASEGIKIWGNKTMQVKETALNRINVRRLLLQTRKLISAVSIRLLFEQNDDIVRNQFLSLVNPILENIRSERGLTDFRVVLDNDPEAIDRNELCGRIFLKPTRSLEFICVEFNIMPTGASFDDI